MNEPSQMHRLEVRSVETGMVVDAWWIGSLDRVDEKKRGYEAGAHEFFVTSHDMDVAADP